MKPSESSKNKDPGWGSLSGRGQKKTPADGRDDRELIKRALENATPWEQATLEQKVDGLAESTNEELSKLRTDIGDIEQKRKKIKKSLSKLTGQVRHDRLQSIQILTIFVAFFTFVSVDFQLFAALQDPLAVLALSLILLGSLLIFVCIVLHIVSSIMDEKHETFAVASFFKNGLVIISLVMFALGTTSYAWLKFDSNGRLSFCRKIEDKVLEAKDVREVDRLASFYQSSGCDNDR